VFYFLFIPADKTFAHLQFKRGKVGGIFDMSKVQNSVAYFFGPRVLGICCKLFWVKSKWIPLVKHNPWG